MTALPAELQDAVAEQLADGFNLPPGQRQLAYATHAPSAELTCDPQLFCTQV
jgi:hypothetical protein